MEYDNYHKVAKDALSWAFYELHFGSRAKASKLVKIANRLERDYREHYGFSGIWRPEPVTLIEMDVVLRGRSR
jgi:hypothetical protein